MYIYRNSIFFLLVVNFLDYLSRATSQDICESCKRIEDCPRYTEMTREQQDRWSQDYPCKAPPTDDSPVSGFSATAKGDYICCPSAEVWGINEDNPESNPKSQGTLNPNNFRNYRINQQPANMYNGKAQASIMNTPQWNGLFDAYGQCPPQTTPPRPESGCCGVDMHIGNRIIDVRQFLRSNYQRSQPTGFFYREKREDDTNEPNVTFENRIAGGQEADLDQYPWTVLLSVTFVNRDEKKYFSCGGSLISSNFVLTAAHCVVNKAGKLDRVEITLAEYDRRSFPRDCCTVRGQNTICIENLQVSATRVYIHPEYVAQYLINDIALIELESSVPYTQYIRPICLPPINIDSPQFSNLPLATAGWGMNVSVESEIKQYTVVNMVPKSECRAHYSHLTDGHLCASGKNTEDTCKGDSGGPLMMMYEGKYYVAGIVSGKTAAFPCGTPVPSLYTNVYYYLDWIRYFVR